MGRREGERDAAAHTHKREMETTPNHRPPMLRYFLSTDF